jgi:hypothetical protein
MAPFDITNIHTNIPTQQLTSVLSIIVDLNLIDNAINKELLPLHDIIIKLLFIQWKIFQQKEGLAMGAPSSALLPEIYLQHIECNFVTTLATECNFSGYFQYVDHILEGRYSSHLFYCLFHGSALPEAYCR